MISITRSRTKDAEAEIQFPLGSWNGAVSKNAKYIINEVNFHFWAQAEVMIIKPAFKIAARMNHLINIKIEGFM
jgi:hypothetical protein